MIFAQKRQCQQPKVGRSLQDMDTENIITSTCSMRRLPLALVM